VCLGVSFLLSMNSYYLSKKKSSQLQIIIHALSMMNNQMYSKYAFDW